MPGQTLITVIAEKFDGSEHRRWRAHLAERCGSLIVLDGEFEFEVDHRELGMIEQGTRSIEYFWLDRWYNIFRFENRAGELRNFYCNISVPAQFDGSIVRFTDLDLDILVTPEFQGLTLDEEEFAANALKYSYPPEIVSAARGAMAELLRMIELRAFPFDGADLPEKSCC